MHHAISRVTLCALGLVAHPLMAQELTSRPFPVKNIESWSFKSTSMGNTYDVVVGLPQGYAENPGKSYATLIVTDGNAMFPAAFDAARSLGGQGDIDGLIVISIGTPNEEGDSAFTRRRVYEFSPANWPRQDVFGKLVSGLCAGYKTPADKCSGGAPAFLNLIVKEILPKAAAKYRIDMNRLGLFGLSAGGFFASWAIFQPNSPFTAYVISSPAMAYGDGEIYRLESQYAETHKDLKAMIYMASGSLEMDHPQFEAVGQIVSGMIRVGAALKSRNYPGLKLVMEIHPGTGHSDTAPTSLNRGLRVVFGK